MEDGCCQRRTLPSTWACMQGKGRVYFIALGNADADVTPNIEKVTPKARQLTHWRPPQRVAPPTPRHGGTPPWTADFRLWVRAAFCWG